MDRLGRHFCRPEPYSFEWLWLILMFFPSSDLVIMLERLQHGMLYSKAYFDGSGGFGGDDEVD